MEYKYAKKRSYEDYFAGRVIYHQKGRTNFSVKITEELINRAMDMSVKSSDLTIYDPCCGSGYLLTIAGFLFPNNFSKIIGSDIDEAALELASLNLSLLSSDGLRTRKEAIEDMYERFQKSSHRDALESVEKFENSISHRKKCPEINLFKSDITKEIGPSNINFKADIIFVDVPYGEIIDWKSESESLLNISLLLESVKLMVDENSILIVSSRKKEIINSNSFKRIKKFNIGKRKIEFLMLKGEKDG